MDIKYANIIEILKVMIKAELALADMYRACNKAWPKDADLWQWLVEQEEQHAEMIKEMIEVLAYEEGDYTERTKYNVFTIEMFIEDIEEKTLKISLGDSGDPY